MGKFIDALKQTQPQMFEEQKKETNEQQNITGMSFQDMKDYFDAMQEKMKADMRKEMSEYIKSTQQETVETEEKGGNENASSSDLQRSE